MQDILSFLKEEFDARVGVILGPDKVLEVIRALEHPAVEAMNIINRSIESQSARIEHLEDVIQRATLRHDADSIIDILNEA